MFTREEIPGLWVCESVSVDSRLAFWFMLGCCVAGGVPSHVVSHQQGLPFCLSALQMCWVEAATLHRRLRLVDSAGATWCSQEACLAPRQQVRWGPTHHPLLA